ncbi:MFS transporter [Desulfitobacterium sp. THU1]|uniref:MFS transporter n=1 Tax=Desulfitobacterium sp. THU1 TaxID=3138072 RepID=UPI00311F6AFD
MLNPYRGMPREIYVIFVARIINAIGAFVGPLMTIIMTQSIGLSEGKAGFYLSLLGVVCLVSSLSGGKLVDRFGRKSIIVLFTVLAAVAYFGIGFMEPTEDMIHFIIVAAAFSATTKPAYDSLIADLTTPANRSGAYALSYLGWNIGFAIGPILGGFLYRHHLSWLFFAESIAIFVTVSLIFIFIPETLGKTREEIQDEERYLERCVEGSIFKVIRQRPLLIFFALIMCGYNFTYSQWSFMLPMQIMKDYPIMGAQYFGFLAAFNGFIVMVFTPIVTRFAGHLPYLQRAVIGGMLYAVGFGMIGILHSLELLFLWAFIFTLGEIVLAITVSPFIADNTPASHRGRMTSTLAIISDAGYTLGPLGMGIALTYINMATGWIALGVSALMFTALMKMLECRERQIALHKSVKALAK